MMFPLPKAGSPITRGVQQIEKKSKGWSLYWEVHQSLWMIHVWQREKWNEFKTNFSFLWNFTYVFGAYFIFSELYALFWCEKSSKCTNRVQVINVYLSTDIIPTRIMLLTIKINYLNYYMINRKVVELQ